MFSEASPVKKSAVFMVFMLCIAIWIYTKAYLPYLDRLKLEAQCAVQTDGVVIKAGEPVREDYYYYGPLVEFRLSNGLKVRSEAVSSVKSSRRYAVGDTVKVGYNGEMNSDIVLLDDTTCRDRYVFVSVTAIVIAFIGILDFFVHAVKEIRRTSAKTYKFKETPDGKSFEEWQKMQNLLEAAGDAQEELSDKARTDGSGGEE